MWYNLERKTGGFYMWGRNTTENIAVIDTETNWENDVMSIGVVIAKSDNFAPICAKYYIIESAVSVGGMYSDVLYFKDKSRMEFVSMNGATENLCNIFSKYNVKKLFAYNAKFDATHLTGLENFQWFDIMRIAAYCQYNKKIPFGTPCCKTGRLKSNYGVEPIMRMLSGDDTYGEVHNALCDAIDELKIMELLEIPISQYGVARI